MAKKKKKVTHGRRRTYTSGDSNTDKKIEELLRECGDVHDREFIREMLVTAIRVGADDMERGDVKMMNASMKELRYALKVFYPYRLIPKVALFGSARTPKSDRDYKLGVKFANEMVKHEWMVITGAATGIMQAGNEGAGRANSFGVNIRLPFEQDANPYIVDDSKLINFKYFFTRKLIFVRESMATVCMPGGFGTHDEGFETLTLIQTGKASPRPVVFLDAKGTTYWKSWLAFVKKELVKKKMISPEDLEIFMLTQDAKKAAQYVVDFYRNYHSMRYIGERLVIRMKRPLTHERLEKLNDQFSDITKKGKIEQYSKPFAEESNEPHLQDYVRLAFCFNRHHFSRLYPLIHQINKS